MQSKPFIFGGGLEGRIAGGAARCAITLHLTAHVRFFLAREA